MNKKKIVKLKNMFNQTFRLALCAAAVAVFLFTVSGCKHKTDETTKAEQTVSVPEGFVLVPVPKDFIEGAEPVCSLPETENYWKGVFIKDRKVRLSPYAMAKTELTYKVWYEVKTWAEKSENGYKFANPGREGRVGIEGAAPTSENSDHPVTKVNWRDCIIWCNAYTEMKNGNGTECVYRKSKDNTAVLKDALNKAECDAVFADMSKKGFRLPTEAEWEYAARWHGVEGDSVDKTNAVKHGNFYLTNLNSASGGKKPIAFEGIVLPPGETFETLRDELSRTSVCNGWWDGTDWAVFNPAVTETKHVCSKEKNILGIYDMSGNVYEWCFDLHNTNPASNDSAYRVEGIAINPQGAASGTERVEKGAAWFSYGMSCMTGYRTSWKPDYKNTDTGLRLVCSIR